MRRFTVPLAVLLGALPAAGQPEAADAAWARLERRAVQAQGWQSELVGAIQYPDGMSARYTASCLFDGDSARLEAHHPDADGNVTRYLLIATEGVLYLRCEYPGGSFEAEGRTHEDFSEALRLAVLRFGVVGTIWTLEGHEAEFDLQSLAEPPQVVRVEWADRPDPKPLLLEFSCPELTGAPVTAMVWTVGGQFPANRRLKFEDNEGEDPQDYAGIEIAEEVTQWSWAPEVGADAFSRE